VVGTGPDCFYTTISNCVVTHNQTGLELETNSQIVTNCRIDSNKIGIDVGRIDPTWSNYITNCMIQYNDTGIVDYGDDGQGSGTNTFTKNTISNNGIGILLGVAVDSFYCNTICTNSVYDLKYLSSSNTNTTIKNYWCTPDSAATRAAIYDGYVNITYGLVGFMPIDSSCSPHSTGINKFTLSNEVNIYPNPNNGSFVIEPNSTTKQTMQVYDVNGKLVLTQTINGKTSIDATPLNEGVYNISLQSNEGVVNKRLVIVR
jgi:hypothetical protein